MAEQHPAARSPEPGSPTPEPEGALQPAADAAKLRERRWSLLRDVASFQVKMIVEGLRDVLLVPLTLGAAAFGLLFGGQHPERLYLDVLRAGHRFDVWLNLFGTLGVRPPSPLEGEPTEEGEERTIDQYFRAIEARLVEQHARGGVTRQAKDKVDGWLDTLHDVTRGKRD